jgi:hypothetical protein
MIAYVLQAQYITIFWSMFGLTSIHFKEKVQCTFAHGKTTSGDKMIQIKYEREGKTVSIAPRQKFDTNFNCYSEDDRMYFFNVKYNESKFSKNVPIRLASQYRGGKLVYTSKKVKIFDAGNNYFIKNLTPKKISINEFVIDREGITSKWLPIDIDGKLVFF